MTQDDQVSFQFDSGAKPAEEGFEPLPVGTYRTICEKVEVGTTLNHDKKWTAFLRIIEGEHTGRYLFENVTFSQKAQNFVFSFFQAFGFDPQPGKAINPKTGDLVGRTVMVKVYGHREGSNGKVYEDTTLLPDSGPMSPQAAPPRVQQPQQAQQFAPIPQADPAPKTHQGYAFEPIPIEPPQPQQPQPPQPQQPQQPQPPQPQQPQPPQPQQPQQGGLENPPF